MPKTLRASFVNDAFQKPMKTKLMGKGICCRPGATTRRIPRALGLTSALFGLEHLRLEFVALEQLVELGDRKSTRLNSSHVEISYAVFCLKKKKKIDKRVVYDKKQRIQQKKK